MALTDTTIRNAERRTRPYTLTDGLGLSLIVNPNGRKWWRFRSRYGRKECVIPGKNTEKGKMLSQDIRVQDVIFFKKVMSINTSERLHFHQFRHHLPTEPAPQKGKKAQKEKGLIETGRAF